ncbi:MAG: hypothetical protein H8E42_01925 [Nitrospinae bacterium]|nr:hypothetical protein [Nitrospinota bacterium]MBL7019713.1 hypothetical protein [Nitrospinaceae bacterium]
MEISIVTVNRVFKTYLGQARIAELNSKNPVKRIQGQRDRVSISNEAKAALNAHATGQSPAGNVKGRPVGTAEFTPDKFEEIATEAPAL